jgi:hypothetical protein
MRVMVISYSWRTTKQWAIGKGGFLGMAYATLLDIDEDALQNSAIEASSVIGVV